MVHMVLLFDISITSGAFLNYYALKRAPVVVGPALFAGYL